MLPVEVVLYTCLFSANIFWGIISTKPYNLIHELGQLENVIIEDLQGKSKFYLWNGNPKFEEDNQFLVYSHSK